MLSRVLLRHTPGYVTSAVGPVPTATRWNWASQRTLHHGKRHISTRYSLTCWNEKKRTTGNAAWCGRKKSTSSPRPPSGESSVASESPQGRGQRVGGAIASQTDRGRSPSHVLGTAATAHQSKPLDVKKDGSNPSEEIQTEHWSNADTETLRSASEGIENVVIGRSEVPKIPDIRAGIPSTHGLEYNGQPTSTVPESNDPVPLGSAIEPSTRGERDNTRSGDLPPSAYETSQDRRRNRFANYMYAALGLFALGGAAFLGREWDDEEERRKHADIPSGWALGSIYGRAKARFSRQVHVFTEPSFPKLLPALDPPTPYTLVVSLEDLLIHSEWSREHGWRMAKRPGVDYFLRYLSQYYELVVFTTLPFASADPIIRKLDPFRVIMWPLAREATRYERGVYIKDLSYLNRDLSRVILLDTDPVHASRQPENAIILKPWSGDPKDRELVSLIPFLEHIATMRIDDTRKVLQSFEGKHIATEFAAREARARELFNQELAEERAKRPKRSGLGLLASALGIKSTNVLVTGEPTAAQGFEQGKTLSDQIRERGQRQYEALEKEIRENGESWLKEMEAEEKRMQEESMKSMKSGFVGWFGVAPIGGHNK